MERGQIVLHKIKAQQQAFKENEEQKALIRKQGMEALKGNLEGTLTILLLMPVSSLKPVPGNIPSWCVEA